VGVAEGFGGGCRQGGSGSRVRVAVCALVSHLDRALALAALGGGRVVQIEQRRDEGLPLLRDGTALGRVPLGNERARMRDDLVTRGELEAAELREESTQRTTGRGGEERHRQSRRVESALWVA
jgi:hypothetical protein